MRTKIKQVKKKSSRVSLAIGESVTMGDISLYSGRAMVGHTCGCHLSVWFLRKWASNQCGSIVSNPPIISRLAK